MRDARSDRFRDRADAGRRLAEALAHYAGRAGTIVLGLPRGGVVVAAEVAARLHAPLDAFLVRKIGAPGQDELAIGAIAAGGVRILNRDLIDALAIPEHQVAAIAAREERELARRNAAYRGGRPDPQVFGRAAILVDDGLATGYTMAAAVEALRRRQPLRIAVAVPVAAPEIWESFKAMVDEAVCLLTPPDFVAVGPWYDDFSPTTDDEVRECLMRNRA